MTHAAKRETLTFLDKRPYKLKGTSRHWYSQAVSGGTHDYVIHTFPPFPLIPIITPCFAQIPILLFTLLIDLF